MRLQISRAVLAGILAEAAASPEVEVCGLLLGRAMQVDRALTCRNVALQPRTSFEIDPQTLIAAYKAARAGGPAVIGYYHSHPTGFAVPSARDAANAVGDGAIWVIVGQGAAQAWITRNPGSFEPAQITIHRGEGGGPASDRS